MQHNTIGWDIGGAHIKAAVVDQQGAVKQVIQQPCPLWKGLHELHQAMHEIITKVSAPALQHAVTMTGELVDLFSSREQGVKNIVAAIEKILAGQKVLIYAGNDGFISTSDVNNRNCDLIASANWLASASYLANKVDNALFVDVGSTTTDILLIADAELRTHGLTDYQRLCSEELVYTGIIRTPVMAIADKALFAGNEVGLMAEYFATMADVYRLTGELNEAHDQTAAADKGEKTISESARRLARMIGCDFHPTELLLWQQFASNLRVQQLGKLQRACERQLSGTLHTAQYPVIGAGVGRFLAKRLAVQLDTPYMDYSDLFQQQLDSQVMTVADCAPAASVACLAIEFG